MSNLSARERLLLFLRVATIAISITTLCVYFGVHAHAQTRMTVTDALQDQRINDLAAARVSQEAYNADQRQKIEGLEEEVSSIKGIGIGAVGVLGILQAVQVVLQLKKKP